MKVLYIESSAILTWLLGESSSRKVISLLNNTEIVLSSVLSNIETERALLRAEHQQIITPGIRQKLRGIFAKVSSGWSFLEISSSIRERASHPFPVESIRTLDAIHLATILEILQIYPDLKVLSFDNRIVDNLIPLGLISAL